MRKYIILIICVIVFVSFSSHSYGEQRIVQKTHEDCIRAYEEAEASFDKSNLQYFAKEKNIHLAGCAGDQLRGDCHYSIVLTLKFVGYRITGELMYPTLKNAKSTVKGAIDQNGNVRLQATGYIHYRFDGIFKETILLGCWTLGEGKKGFDFWAEVQPENHAQKK